VSTIFTAVCAEDSAKFDSVIAPDFYVFANGTRFNGDAIMGIIKPPQAAGKRYDEHVIEPDIHISGNMAWIAYANKGSITDASGTMNQPWFESAFLQKTRRHPGRSRSCTIAASLLYLKTALTTERLRAALAFHYCLATTI
jgi:hypothetical protein